MDERILIIEDDEEILRVLNRVLTYEGYFVDTALTGLAGLTLASEQRPDLVILDWMLPKMDGLEVCRRLQQIGNQPILMLTAKDTLHDRVEGLDAGADDYVVKPVEMPELLARCRAVLRRPGDRSDTILRFGALELDTAARSVSWDGRSVALGRRETTVLEHLMRAAGRVAPRRTLEEAVYGFDDEVGPNALEASVSRLRRALAAAGCPLPIVTVRGVGWMLPRDDAR